MFLIFFSLCKKLTLLPPYPRGSWFEPFKIKSTLLEDATTQVSAFLAICFREEVLEFSLYISLCKNSNPYCGPILLPGIMIITSLNLPYLRTLFPKFQVSLYQKYYIKLLSSHFINNSILDFFISYQTKE